MKRSALSTDALLFLALAGVQLWVTLSGLSLLASLVVSVIGCYVAIDIFVAPSRSFILKLCLIWLLIAVIVIAPTVGWIYLRYTTVPHKFVHDGQIQIEEAIKFLLAAKNPYAEDYLNTPMAQWIFREGDLTHNPGLYHFVYLPFLFVFSIPFYLSAQVTLGWFDQRMIYLPMFVMTLLFLSRMARARERQLALLILVGLNPLFSSFVVEGRNDIFVLFWLALSVLLIPQQRLLSVVALAFACASKSTAWFILPFYAVYFFRLEGSDPLRGRTRLLPIVVFVVLVAVIVLPFVFWDSNAFLDDVWHYTAGSTQFAYPIKSWGFGGIALTLGWIGDPLDVFPFGVLQLIFGLPVLFLLIRYQLAQNTTGRMWLCYGLFTFVIAFFSRVFNDNHLGYILTVFAIGALTEYEVDAG
jgi:hypothetical protein